MHLSYNLELKLARAAPTETPKNQRHLQAIEQISCERHGGLPPKLRRGSRQSISCAADVITRAQRPSLRRPLDPVDARVRYGRDFSYQTHRVPASLQSRRGRGASRHLDPGLPGSRLWQCSPLGVALSPSPRLSPTATRPCEPLLRADDHTQLRGDHLFWAPLNGSYGDH